MPGGSGSLLGLNCAVPAARGSGWSGRALLASLPVSNPWGTQV